MDPKETGGRGKTAKGQNAVRRGNPPFSFSWGGSQDEVGGEVVGPFVFGGGHEEVVGGDERRVPHVADAEEGEVVNLKAPKAEAEAIRRWARERRMSTSYAVGIAIRMLTEEAERHS